MPTLTINNFADLKVGDVALFQLDDGNDITGEVTFVDRTWGTARMVIGKRAPLTIWLPRSAFASATREVPRPEPKFKPGTRVEVIDGVSKGTILTPRTDLTRPAATAYVRWDGYTVSYFVPDIAIREIPGFSVGDKVVVRQGAVSFSSNVNDIDTPGTVLAWRDPDWPRRNGENHLWIQHGFSNGNVRREIYRYEDVSPAVSGSTEVIGAVEDRQILLVGSVSDLRKGDIVVGGPFSKPAAATISREAEQ